MRGKENIIEVALTFDVDWAPEKVIEDTLLLLQNAGLTGTFFATHHSPILKSAEREGFEIAIHPNFNNILSGNQQKDFRSIVDDLINEYPNSKGIRSHSLTCSSQMLSYFKTCGLIYDSNMFIPYQQNLKPFISSNGLVRIPYFWEDDVHYEFGREFTLSDIEISHGLNVFDFHPIHVYLNTDCQNTYDKAKKYYQDPSFLLSCRNIINNGSRSFLEQLIHKVVIENIKTVTLSEVAERLLDNRF